MAEAAPITTDMNGVHLSPAAAAAAGASCSRRYSSDDIGCHYSSLSHAAREAREGPRPRRQSVATVHTEGHHHHHHHGHGHGRPSQASDHDRRPSRSRGNPASSVDRWAMNGGVGRARLGPSHLESARLSLSSDRHRKSCRDSTSEAGQEADVEEERRSRAVLVCASVAVAILLTAILLVAITLTMAPAIDEMVRKENEEILRELEEASSGASLANSTVPEPGRT